MFDKLKQLKQLKDLQDSLSREKEEYESCGVKVIVNGKMEIEEIKINSDLKKEDLEREIKDCVNEAVKRVQIKAAQKMSQMGGFGL